MLYDHGRFGLAIYDDAIRVVLDKAQGPHQHHLVIRGLDLDDGQFHRVTVMADQKTDRLQVLLDDEVVLDRTDNDFNVDFDGRRWGWDVGTPWNSNNFVGEIGERAAREWNVVLRARDDQRSHRRRPAVGVRRRDACVGRGRRSDPAAVFVPARVLQQ